jgi:hypothetical protein
MNGAGVGHESQSPSEKWFERLVPLLEGRKLPCERSPARVCEVDEFMFMHESGGTGHFKHSTTRNYISVKPYVVEKNSAFQAPSPNGYVLVVPFTLDAFMRGFFDE